MYMEQFVVCQILNLTTSVFVYKEDSNDKGCENTGFEIESLFSLQ